MYIVDGKKLFLAALARKMRQLGYKATASHVHRVFTGERDPGPNFIEGMAKAMNKTREEAKEVLAQAREAHKEYDRIPEYL